MVTMTRLLGVVGALVAAVNVTALPAGAAIVAQVSTSNAHTCAVTTAGDARCWGWNRDGHLGDGTRVDRDVPVRVLGLGSDTIQIAAGGFHGCALLSWGGVRCWGANDNGELGDGTVTRRLAPVDVASLGNGVAQIAAGGQHTCALTSAGGVKCWGFNAHGELGDGTTTDRHLPVDVTGLGSGVASIIAGGYHTCAITTGGGAKCWGLNTSGVLGDGSRTDRLVPVDVSGLTSGVTRIAAGYNHTCALVGGGAKCWGQNGRGQIGDDGAADQLVPTDVSGLAANVTRIGAGGFHSCAVVSGGAKCWGSNDFNQLGDNEVFPDEHHTPIDVFGLGAGVAEIAVGYSHTCAVTVSGKLACWGNNGHGKLGDNTTFGRIAPVYVQGFGGIATRVTLRSSAPRARVGQRVTYTARIKPRPGGGRVRFTDRGNPIKGCGNTRVVDGVARCRRSYSGSGRHIIVANYLGIVVFKASASPRLVQIVG
jgi:alpha-tubulin suppressor-like RCC1 family protein